MFITCFYYHEGHEESEDIAAYPFIIFMSFMVKIVSFPRAAWECSQGALRREKRSIPRIWIYRLYL